MFVTLVRKFTKNFARKFASSFQSSQIERHDVREFVAIFGNNEETSESVRQKFYEIICKRSI
jgi:hypothetical protein